jgi:hypothetical protein
MSALLYICKFVNEMKSSGIILNSLTSEFRMKYIIFGATDCGGGYSQRKLDQRNGFCTY